jgi:hypothetical protein
MTTDAVTHTAPTVDEPELIGLDAALAVARDRTAEMPVRAAARSRAKIPAYDELRVLAHPPRRSRRDLGLPARRRSPQE